VREEMQTAAGISEQIKIGDRVEFRCYGYQKQYAKGKVIRIDEKGVVVRVERAMRNARVEFDDIVKVLNNA
jgi:hypothetical protein